MVWSRWQKVGHTKIKSEYFGDDAKTSKACLGVDVSGLYLHNLMCEQPTGAFVRRRATNDFRAEYYHSHSHLATEWIPWLSHQLGITFQHKFTGNEKRVTVRQLPVDGYCELENGEQVVLQFLGCYYHSHGCESCPSGIGQDEIADLENRLNTYENLRHLRLQGFTVISIWECQFTAMKITKPEVRDYCNQLDFLIDKRYKLTQKQIIEEVKSGTLFAFVECDIETPDHLKDTYSEFQLVIKHSLMSRDDVSPTMKAFAEKHDLLKKPTKTLLCSHFANKILMSTPLLSWLLNKGLVVTKAYQVIQDRPAKCFQRFGEEVMAARRAGDRHPSLKIQADSSKLLG